MGPGDAQLPRFEVRVLRGRHRRIPFYLDRSDRHYTNQKWLRRDFGDKLPSDVFREHSLACYVTDKTSLKLRHEIGIDISRGSATIRTPTASGPTRPSRCSPSSTPRAPTIPNRQNHLAELLPVLRLGSLRPHARDQANVAALRAKATDVDVSIRPRKEWARLYEQKQLAKT